MKPKSIKLFFGFYICTGVKMKLREVVQVDSTKHWMHSTEKTDEGFLKVKAPIARTGVYRYTQADGSVLRQLVTSETLDSYEANETLKLKPVVNTHPTELLNTDTVKDLKIGSVGETVFFDGEEQMLFASFVITDGDAITAIEEGLRELSPAYKCFLIEQSGTHNGEQYDVIQANRRYNHLAIVPSARGGSSLAIMMDGAGEYVSVESVDSNNEGEEGMVKINLDGAELEVPEAVKDKIESLEKTVEDSKAEVSTLTAEKDVAIATTDGLKAQIKELEDGFDAKVSHAVAERSKMVTALDGVDGIDAKTNTELRSLVIAKAFPKISLDGKDEAYTSALFDASLEVLNADATSTTREGIVPIDVQTTNVDAVESSRARMVKESETAWKKGE
jgi:hypothetical protein